MGLTEPRRMPARTAGSSRLNCASENLAIDATKSRPGNATPPTPCTTSRNSGPGVSIGAKDGPRARRRRDALASRSGLATWGGGRGRPPHALRLAAAGGPGRPQRPDVERPDPRRAALGEQLYALAFRLGEDLVGDHPVPPVGEHLDRGPVDEDPQAHLAVAGGERGALHAREVAAEVR